MIPNFPFQVCCLQGLLMVSSYSCHLLHSTYFIWCMIQKHLSIVVDILWNNTWIPHLVWRLPGRFVFLNILCDWIQRGVKMDISISPASLTCLADWPSGLSLLCIYHHCPLMRLFSCCIICLEDLHSCVDLFIGNSFHVGGRDEDNKVDGLDDAFAMEISLGGPHDDNYLFLIFLQAQWTCIWRMQL